MNTGTPTLVDRGRGMTVADLQAYLNNLADAIAAATRSHLGARDLRAAVEALAPFADLTLESLTALLGDAREYARTGKVVVPTPRRRARGDRTTGELTAMLDALRARAAADPFISRGDVERAIGEFGSLPRNELWTVAQSAGLPDDTKAMRASILESLVQLVMDAREVSGPAPVEEYQETGGES